MYVLIIRDKKNASTTLQKSQAVIDLENYIDEVYGDNTYICTKVADDTNISNIIKDAKESAAINDFDFYIINYYYKSAASIDAVCNSVLSFTDKHQMLDAVVSDLDLVKTYIQNTKTIC